MDRLDCSESVCGVCKGKTVAFLWVRGPNKESRWVISDASNVNKNVRVDSLGICSCRVN
jgi:hypothetical protein